MRSHSWGTQVCWSVLRLQQFLTEVNLSLQEICVDYLQDSIDLNAIVDGCETRVSIVPLRSLEHLDQLLPDLTADIVEAISARSRHVVLSGFPED